MPNRKNIISFLIRSLLVFIFLAVVFIVFTPSLINLEMVKKTIKENISSNVGGRITYRNLKLSYLPRPHVVIHEAEISIPESYTINIQWMRIYPKIMPLFKGQLQFDYIRLDYADYFMKLPRIRDAARQQSDKSQSLDEMVASFTKAVRDLPEFKLPDLNLKVKNGRVNLIDPYGHKFMLRELQAEYVRRRSGLEFSIQCKSNLWERINIGGSLDPSDFKGLGRVQLSHFRPQSLIAYLFPDSALQITETRASVNIDFQSDGAGNIKADVTGTIPFLEFRRGGEQLVVKGVQVKGTVAAGGSTIRADLTDLGLEYPAVHMTGMFLFDENLRDIQLVLNGSRIDAASVRQAALALAGESETVRTVFDIIRGGQVPWMTVKIRGQAIRDFGLLDNIVIQGRMTQGRVFIPGAELDLEEVFGDAVISNGILKGEKLQARFGKSYGQDGSIALGLTQDPTPFHLDIGVNADLSQLPPVLNRIVADQDFLGELGRVKDVEGTALGKLILGDDLENLSARVEVSQVQVNVRYNRIPYPITISGGRFLFEPNRIAVQNFNAAIGNSSLSQLSTTIDWTHHPILDTISKTARFDLTQLHAWLLSFDAIKTSLADVRSLSGVVAAEDFSIKGPMLHPQNWHFQTRGTIDKLTLTSGRLPQPVWIQGGKFACRGTQLDFSKLDASMGKSSAAQVSGHVDWTRKPVVSVAANASLFNLEDIIPLLLSSKALSKALKAFRPLKGTLAFERLTYSGPLTSPTSRQLSVSANIRQLTLSSRRLPGTLRVNKGQFAWHKNQLELKNIEAALGKSSISQLSAGFYPDSNGTFDLHCGTARLAAGEIHPFLSSFAELQSAVRDFSTSDGILLLTNVDLSGPFHKPAEWQYKSAGRMQHVVVHSEALAEPATVDRATFELSAEMSAGLVRRRIVLQAANLTLKNKPLTIAGSLSSSVGAAQLDISIDAEGPEWNQITKLLDYLGQRMEPSKGAGRPSHLKGTIKFLAHNFYYESFTVKPLEAEVTFQQDKAVVTVKRADICGISLRGLVNISDQTLDLYFVPTPIDHSLDSTITCLTTKKSLATGMYNLNGEIMAKSKPEALSRSLNGKLSFSAEKGRIYRFGLLAKLLAILNVTEIYRGHVPDLAGEGFAYHSMSASAKLQGGKITMEECSIDGASMGIACEGDIDLSRKEMDLIILVAPFKTVDRIVDILPLIGRVLGGKLISIPFRAVGDLNDPDVYPLPPTAVGSGLLGILERTLKLPLTIIQPVISGLKKGKPNQPGVGEESPH